MARPTHVYTIDYVATLIGENIELIQQVASNSDNIDYGEMIHVHDGSEEGITTFTDRGSKACRHSSPISEPGTEVSSSSLWTSNVIQKGSSASWQTSRNHKPRGLRRMDTFHRAAPAVISAIAVGEFFLISAWLEGRERDSWAGLPACGSPWPVLRGSPETVSIKIATKRNP
ncbi:hypothetical protein [Rhizobium sp. TRM95796]|uniref:hypothetical protein n=1 Tax=Rhizobium sp. TRM95796 TaxID=2979862 RepID=UPI0021E90267|nr:hypothetical protein [Rhizobium sp. TRM95796]MCV3769091.1 hypothetical protein [Rhizobium sp. TRM95796]